MKRCQKLICFGKAGLPLGEGVLIIFLRPTHPPLQMNIFHLLQSRTFPKKRRTTKKGWTHPPPEMDNVCSFTLMHKITISPSCVLFSYQVREIELAWNIHQPWGELPSQTFFKGVVCVQWIEGFNLQGMFLSVCEVTLSWWKTFDYQLDTPPGQIMQYV